MSNILSEVDKFANRIDKINNLQEQAFFFRHEGKNLFGFLHLPLNRAVSNWRKELIGSFVQRNN